MQNFFQIDIVWAGVITDAPPVTSILSNVLNFLLSIIGVLGIIGLAVAGVLYMVASDDERLLGRAKRTALASVIGLGIALGAFILTGQLTAFFSR